ncbi:MAG TPA: tail fiber protein, partial [Thermoanaerobaculia bacterium]|nr:tail fiber protein [Thermoanaerobaculia bacterium]
MPYTGEIRMFAGTFAPLGWALCDGSTLNASDYPDLAVALSPIFGGDGIRFSLPDLRGRIPIGTGGTGSTQRSLGTSGGQEFSRLSIDEMPAHSHPLSGSEWPATSRSPRSGDRLAESQGRIYGPPENRVTMSSLALSTRGDGGMPHDNMQPSLCVNFIISLSGSRPSDPDFEDPFSAFLGEIKITAGDYAWAGWTERGRVYSWMPCDGRLLSISQNSALFSLLGPFYGGDGRTTFALPDLRGRAPMHAGAGPGLTPRFLSDSLGSETVTLDLSHLPTHNHSVLASSSRAGSNDPGRNLLAVPFNGDNLYATPDPSSLVPTAPAGATGGGQPHNNMQPYLPLMFMIANIGIFPPRS